MTDFTQVATTKALPKSDTLYRRGDRYIRLRVLRRTTKQVAVEAPARGSHEVIALVFQCSLTDASGDVLKDSEGQNIVLGGEVHTITADALRSQTVQEWMAEVRADALKKADDKAVILDVLKDLDVEPEAAP